MSGERQDTLTGSTYPLVPSENATLLDAILESAMDAIITIDDQHRIVVFNLAAAAMFGVTAEQVMGVTYDRVVESHDYVPTAVDIHEPFFIAAGTVGRITTFGETGDGRYVPMSTIATLTEKAVPPTLEREQKQPSVAVTTNLRALRHRFDHFDLADAIDFVSIESTSAIKPKSADLACEIDMLRSLKKTGVRAPDGDNGFWVMEQKAGNVSWQEVNSVIRPGYLRMFTYQLISRGATAVLFFRWRQPRIGSEKFHGAVMPHHLSKDARIYREVAQIGEELKMLAPALKNSRVTPEVCIVYSHDNDWALQQPN